QYHQLIKKLLKDDIFQGLRVDHVDGLYDPESYLTQLRELAGPQSYVVVEKILEKGEELVGDWPIQGTSGYDFLAQLNNLFTSKNAEKAFNDFYRTLSEDSSPHEEQIRAKKKLILEGHMGGELQNLCHLLLQYQDIESKGKGADEEEEHSNEEHSNKEQNTGREEQLKNALSDFLIHCPVYRYYRSTADQAEALVEKLASQNKDLLPAYQTLKEALRNDEHFFNR